MGKHWIYILKNNGFDEDDESLYIGETTRLYSRFNEHLNNRGGKNTAHFGNFDNVELVGLYNVANNDAFENYHNIIPNFEEFNSIWDLKWIYKDWRDKQESNDYDFLMIENLITEMCIYLNRNNYIDVKGGKYTKKTCYKQQIQSYPKHRPVCKCGYPAEVFLSQKDEIWFKCAVANAEWVQYQNKIFSVAEPCNFLQKYNYDIELRQKFQIFEKCEASETVKKIPKLSYKIGIEGEWLQELPCIICKRQSYNPIFNLGFRSLCKICLGNRFDEINTINVTPKYKLILDSDED